MKVKIKIRKECNRRFLAMGRILIKKGEVKEYNDCQELRLALERNYIEEVKETKPKPKVIKKKVKKVKKTKVKKTKVKKAKKKK